MRTRSSIKDLFASTESAHPPNYLILSQHTGMVQNPDSTNVEQSTYAEGRTV